jgi:hypothetical protein
MADALAVTIKRGQIARMNQPPWGDTARIVSGR